VRVDVTAELEMNCYRVRVKVSDTRIGISPLVLDRLFERFVQGDSFRLTDLALPAWARPSAEPW